MKSLIETGHIHLATIIGIVAALIPAISQWLSLDTPLQVLVTTACLLLFLKAVTAANEEKKKLQTQNDELSDVQERLKKAELWNTSYSQAHRELADLNGQILPLVQVIADAKSEAANCPLRYRDALEDKATKLEDHYQQLLQTKAAATARLELLYTAIIELTHSNPELAQSTN